MSFNAIRENKILAKISEFTVLSDRNSMLAVFSEVSDVYCLAWDMYSEMSLNEIRNVLAVMWLLLFCVSSSLLRGLV